MAHLSFPEPPNFIREQSYRDHGTPFSSAEDIPIDPALNATALDPVLLAESGRPTELEVCNMPEGQAILEP